jgi:hypothetical protein
VTFPGVGFPYPSDSASDWFSIADKRLALMSRVTGRESPAELGAIYAYDKQLSIQEAQAKVKYEYTSQWQDSIKLMQKKESERRQRMIDNGVIFF